MFVRKNSPALYEERTSGPGDSRRQALQECDMEKRTAGCVQKPMSITPLLPELELFGGHILLDLTTM